MTGTEPLYPAVTVRMTGEDGNAFAIIGRVWGALQRAGVDREAIVEFRTEATSSDYTHLLATVERWVNVT